MRKKRGPAAHILIAEDNEDDQTLLKRALERVSKKCGTFTFAMVDNGLEARQYLERKPKFADRDRYPDATLLLSDLKMPMVDGFELLEWVRGRQSVKHLPFIIFTSSDLDEDVRRAYGLGANTIFAKPCEWDGLQKWADSFTEYWCSLALMPDAARSER
jgi:CheY-like chemotaxis protein